MKTTTIDFETEDIAAWHPLPPRPVGVSIKPYHRPSRYYAWGHPTENNCTVAQATDALRNAVSGRCVFHNAKFDIAVAQHWFGCPYPRRVEDTLFLAYLHDPRDRSLELKVLADKYLGMPPDEQLELRDWLFEHVKGARAAKKNWSKYISQAPGGLVGKYAVGDTDRTEALYDYMLPIIRDLEMDAAYERELRLLPTIMGMERRGVRICPSVHAELERRDAEFNTVERRIVRKLGDDFSIGHGASLFNAMERKGLVDHSKVEHTEKGNPRTGRDFVPLFCKDKRLVADLQMRSRLEKIVGTYLRPWAAAQAADGYFYPYFNQTRGAEKGGTRTGRLSSNFQQVPREPDVALDLPFLRNFILPDEGHTLIARDYSQQELRILAHYAEGALLEAYIADPDMDVHTWVRQLIEDVAGVVLERSPVKQANFLQVYGGGGPALSRNIPCPLDAAYVILKAHRKALPEVPALSKAIERQVRAGTLLRTWGGRLYDVEEGLSKQGRWEALYYKLINVLIQGSAADQTKELMINYAAATSGRIMVQAHDELLASVPTANVDHDMCVMRTLMDDSTGWDVPMRSDGKFGPSWGGAIKYDDTRCTRRNGVTAPRGRRTANRKRPG